MARPLMLSLLILAAAFRADGALAQIPPAIAAPGEVTVATFHAEGAQVYECTARSDGKPIWVFREPIATLLLDNKTVGRHYAGPTWELMDGSAVAGKALGNASGTTANDIPWLKLDVVNRRGSGTLANVTTVQRIHTRGGTTQGACDQVGAFLSVPYSADYVFLSRDDAIATGSVR